MEPDSRSSRLRRSLLSSKEAIGAGFAAAGQVRPSALWNGLSAGVGVGCAAAVGELAFPDQAAAVMLGALCVSLADTPVSPIEKLRRMAFACALCGIVTLATSAAAGNGWTQAADIAVVGFIAAMVSGYGRSAVPISVSALLALVFGRSLSTDGGTPTSTAAIFFAGGAIYIVYAALTAPVLATLTKRMLLREALDALSALLRAQGAELAEDVPVGASPIVGIQANLAERIQTARDAIFVGVSSERERLYAGLLVVLIDALEAAVSQQPDLTRLRQVGDERTRKDARAHLLLAATDLDRFSRSLAPGGTAEPLDVVDRSALRARLAEDLRMACPVAAPELLERMDRLFEQIQRLWKVRDSPKAAAATIAGIDLASFVQTISFDPRLLAQHFRIQSPVLRFAVRLPLAMLAGWLFGELLPSGAHSIWILLTVVLVMRANYSISKQRRDQRLFGNIIGCGVAAAILTVAPAPLLPFVMFTAAGLSHAFAVQSYLVASIASCVMALTLIHLAEPSGAAVFFLLRIVDTALGALIAQAFSFFILPSWERAAVRAQIPDLIAAARAYARQALSPSEAGEDYRRARRRLHETTAALSLAVRRMVDEPESSRSEPRALARLLNASYAFAAEMAALRVVLTFPKEAGALSSTDPAQMEEAVDALLAPPGERDPRSLPQFPAPRSPYAARAVRAARELASSAFQAQETLAEPPNGISSTRGAVGNRDD